MLKRFISISLLLTVFVFIAVAQDDSEMWKLSGDFTTIYSLGNAIGSGEDNQRLDVEPIIAGAFFNNPVTGTRKNGFFTAGNVIVEFNPTPWLQGYFRLYAVHRPGSFYMPLQMENMSNQIFALTLDEVFGRANLFGALGLDLPVDLFLKAGRYRARAAEFGTVSKYRTERVLFMMNTRTDFTYELEVRHGPFSFSAATNYLLSESVPRYYDEDESFMHGNIMLNEYAPQFMVAARVVDIIDGFRAELIYGMNLSNIYSGHNAGASLRYELDMGNIKIPIGLAFAFHEKNIDLLGQAAIAEPLPWASGTPTTTTMSFRETIAIGFGAGLRFAADAFKVDVNLAGGFYNINHYYRDPLQILRASFDTMVTIMDNYFVGGGIIFGNLLGTTWKTRDGVLAEDYNQEFGILENMGYEFYAGINLGNNSTFVVGFNQNKGISINNMLESRHDAQLKFKQAGTSWGTDQLLETSALYIKFAFRF
jgi:hypothetical protein